jgi:hypothetical protein
MPMDEEANLLLESRKLTNNPLDNAKEEFINAPRTFHTIKKRDAYCKHKMIEKKEPIFTLNAYNTPASSSKLPDEYFFGLENKIHLQKGMPVVLTYNLWPEVGLFNSA